MGLTPDSLLKKRIAHNWEEYGDTPYDTDFIVGFAESELPIYYSEIIEQWQQLPMEHSDSTIFKLMTTDLFNYYSDRTSDLLDQIRQDKDNA
jgi:hypothetical protein